MVVIQEKNLLSSIRTQTRSIRADVTNGIHYPVERVRTRTVGVEKGFLVIGPSAIIFLKPDNETVVASHPFVFIEGYKLVDETTFCYALKTKYFLKKGKTIEITFKMPGTDAAMQVLSALDRNCLIDTKTREASNEDRREVPLSYFDPSLKTDLTLEDASVRQAVHMIDGERFVAKEWYPKKRFIDGQDAHTYVILIVNARGICLLQQDDAMEVHSWETIKSFGASMHKTSNDTFAFLVNDPNEESDHRTVAISTESATAINACCHRYIEQQHVDPRLMPGAFPAQYEVI